MYGVSGCCYGLFGNMYNCCKSLDCIVSNKSDLFLLELSWGDLDTSYVRCVGHTQETPNTDPGHTREVKSLIGLGRYKKAEVRSKGGLGIFAYTTNVIWTQISDRKWIGNGKDS